MIPKRKQIKQELETLEPFYFGGPIEDVINRISELKNRYEKGGYTEVTIDINRYYDEILITLLGTRLETDAEYNKRIQEELKKEENRLIRAQKRKEKEQQKIKEAQEKISAIRSKYNLPKELDLDTLKNAVKELEDG